MELANDKFSIHADTCALAALIVADDAQQDPDEIIRRLGLEELPESRARRDSNSIMRREPVVGDKFEEGWNWLQTI